MRGFNSTIKIKKRACKSCGKDSFIFSRGRCADCARQEDNQDKSDENETGESMAYLISDLDALCSLIVRMSAADKDGFVKCYTCEKKIEWKYIQNGHYISRKSMFLRWDIRNLRPQCEFCNVTKRGNLAEYGKRLEQERDGITEILLEESRIVHHWTRDELRGMVVEFNRQLDILKNKHKT